MLDRHRRRIVRIVRRVDECLDTVSLYMHNPFSSDPIPGQFTMIWIPGVDEIPLSISYMDSCILGVTVRGVGEATRILCSLQPGDTIGVRGPLGRGFTIVKGRSLVVGGGVGVAPLRYLIYRLIDVGVDTYVVFGFRDKLHTIYLEEMEKLSVEGRIKLCIATEDGSYGFKATAYDIASRILDESFDMVYVCGPEELIRRILVLCVEKDLPMEASIEGYMKCGMGVCGSCVRGAYLVCRDGPVFDRDKLLEIGEIGLRRRRASGTIEPLL
ncbi:MAG: dihydroorotate dehydrogenase electron transfer subunit [Candidatus Bathyarchaeia archaeon]